MLGERLLFTLRLGISLGYVIFLLVIIFAIL